MNANEVISNRAIELAGGDTGIEGARSTRTTTSTCPSRPTTRSRRRCTSPPSNRSSTRCCPRCGPCATRWPAKAEAFADIVKIGRTHLMDAVPLTLGQEFSGYVAQLDADVTRIDGCLSDLYELALGGTAVGTGLNAHPEFGDRAAAHIAALTGLPFVSAPNKFSGAGRPRRPGAGERHAAHAGGVAHQDRRRHPLARVRAHGPGWPSSCSRPTSRARRSCRARSTPPSARP